MTKIKSMYLIVEDNGSYWTPIYTKYKSALDSKRKIKNAFKDKKLKLKIEKITVCEI